MNTKYIDLPHYVINVKENYNLNISPKIKMIEELVMDCVYKLN